MPQVSILGPLFFLIYINDLSENLKSTVKLFAEDTLTYQAVKDHNTSAEILSHTLLKFLNGHNTDGKCHLVRTIQNKLKKCYFLIKPQRQIIQIYSMVTWYTIVPIKAPWSNLG